MYKTKEYFDLLIAQHVSIVVAAMGQVDACYEEMGMKPRPNLGIYSSMRNSKTTLSRSKNILFANWNPPTPYFWCFCQLFLILDAPKCT